MKMKVETDYGRWGAARRMSVDAFLATCDLPDGLTVIEHGVVELPMLVSNRGAPATFVGFHAAMNPAVRRPVPFFQGRQVAPAGLNSILLCDPSLYLHPAVTAGWFLGNREMALREILPRVLDHADGLMGAKRRLLWGNSAGGTAALAYGRAEDVTVTINPQTILSRFTRGRTRPYIRHGWAANDRDGEEAVMAAIGDLRICPPKGRIVYVQNTSDDHLDLHMRPLADAMGMAVRDGEQGRFRVMFGDWGRGHIPPPPAQQRRIVEGEARRLLAEMGAPVGWGARVRGWLGR
ncbi:hypothetical protein ACM608_17400 [Sphingomonas sp. ID0503]